MRKKMTANILLLVAAFIWGSAFVAQSIGMDYVRPFTYIASRNLLGFLVLIPVILIMRRNILPNKTTLIGGVICGVILFVASSFQQFGLLTTSSGKAGFITALYVIIVPIIGLAFRKKPSPIIWACVVIALIGFYLLCVKEGFSFIPGDLIVLCCAVLFACHIIGIDFLNDKGVDGIKLSAIQFITASIIGWILALIFEDPSIGTITDAWLPICYAGILSSGVAYTFQILGQKNTDPTSATLIMSLESVFAALSGWVIQNEILSVKELIGCGLVFTAVIVSQLPIGKKTT